MKTGYRIFLMTLMIGMLFATAVAAASEVVILYTASTNGYVEPCG
jgi:hypothetical protein